MSYYFEDNKLLIGEFPVSINLSINGLSIISNVEQILAEVISESSLQTTKPIENFGFALMSWFDRNFYHFEPYTGYPWAHSPELFANSLGFGFCDDVAAIFYQVATKMGYESRVWVSPHHTIPELKIDDGRWVVFDPDLRAV